MNAAIRLALMALLFQTPALHKDGATVSGVVRDATDAVVPGAEIRITGACDAAVLKSDERGRYEVRLAPGTYDLTAEQRGFCLYRRAPFTLTARSTSALDLSLDVCPTHTPLYYDTHSLHIHTGGDLKTMVRYTSKQKSNESIEYAGNEYFRQHRVMFTAGYLTAYADMLHFVRRLHLVKAEGNITVEYCGRQTEATRFEFDGVGARLVDSRGRQLPIQPTRCPAPTEGVLTATVVDPSGAIIPAARVIVRDVLGVEAARTSTSSDGTFSAILAHGTFDLEVTAPGFKTTLVRDVRIAAEALELGPIKLEVGSVGGCDPGPWIIPGIDYKRISTGEAEVHGAVVPYDGVSVTLQPLTTTGRQASVTTGPHGQFVLRGVVPGEYRLVARRQGFADFVIDRLEARDGSAAVIASVLSLQPCPLGIKCRPVTKVQPVAICL